MVYEERNTWSSLVGTTVALAAYVTVVLKRAGDGPLTDVEWWPVMLWTTLGGIVVAIVLSIVWGVVAARTDPDDCGRSDVRDRDIARTGWRVGQTFMLIAGFGVLVLCAVEAHWFWVASTMFLGFAVAALVDGVARVVAYRRGLA